MLLGGSPLRLLRLAPRARTLLAGDRLVVRDAPIGGARRPAARRRPRPPRAAAVPGAGRRHGRHPGPGPAGGPRPPARRAAGGSRDRPAAGRRGRRRLARPRPVERACRRVRRAGIRREVSRGPAAARNAGLRAARTASRRVPRLRLRAAPRAGSSGCDRTWPIPGWPWSRRGSSGLTGGAPGWPTRLRGGGQRARHGARPGAGAAVVRGLLRAQRRAAGPAGGAGRRASTRRCGSPRTSTSSGGWSAAGWRVRYEPRGTSWRTSTPSRTTDWLRRRAFYGTGAALLAARHGRGGRAGRARPRRRRRRGRWRSPAVGGAGWPRRPRSWPSPPLRLARRLAAPGGRPPLGFAAGAGPAGERSRRGARWPGPSPGTTGRSAVPLPAASRRARRWLLAVAVVDAGAAWWPQPARWDRSVSPPPAGWTTSPTAPACGGAPSARATSARSCRPARPGSERLPGRPTPGGNRQSRVTMGVT